MKSKLLFGIDSQQSLPAEIETSYQAWDNYMAHIWYNLFYFLDIQSNSILVEIAPGSSTKIAIALAKLFFSGKLYLIEPHNQLARIAKDQYQALLPAAEIIVLNKPLDSALSELPEFVDAIMANHPLDDMLLVADNPGHNELFNWAYDKESYPIKNFVDTWRNLKSNPAKLLKNSLIVLHQWQQAVKQIKPMRILLSQYPSYTLEQPELYDLNIYATQLLYELYSYYHDFCIPKDTIQKILNGMKHYNHEHIANNILNARNWLITKHF